MACCAIEKPVEARRVHRSPPSPTSLSRCPILNRMKSPQSRQSWPRFGSFPGVVLSLYQNDLRNASTKIAVCSIIQETLICRTVRASFQKWHLPFLGQVSKLVRGAKHSHNTAGELSGLIERVTFFDEDGGSAYSRSKPKGTATW